MEKKRIGTCGLGVGTWESRSEILNFNTGSKVQQLISAKHKYPIIFLLLIACLSFILFAARETPTGGGEETGQTVTAFKLNDYVTPPVKDTAPDTTPVDAVQYYGTVSWLNSDNTPLSGNFSANTEYKAKLDLTAKEGWTFIGVPTNYFSYAGARYVTNEANSGVVTITFDCTAKDPITGEVTIDGTPEIGENLTANIENAVYDHAGTVSYQWQKSNSSNGTFTSIDDATDNVYTPVLGDWGQYLRVQIEATGNAGKFPSDSVLIEGDPGAPLNKYLETLNNNDKNNPYNIKLVEFYDVEKIGTALWETVNSTIRSAGKYVILDLSAYDDTSISGEEKPSGSDFNIIKDNEYIAGLILPDTLETIGKYALYGCNSLTKVDMPENLEAIDDYAFSGTFLTSITIPDNVKTIGAYAFYNCTNIAALDLGSGIQTIGDNAFDGCIAISSLHIPASLISIGEDAFKSQKFTSIDCDVNNKTIFYENGILYQKDYPESDTSSLSIVVIISSLSGEVVIHEGVTTLPTGTASGTAQQPNQFMNMTSITSVSIPGTVSTIPSSCFNGCTGITSITLGEGIKGIMGSAFAKVKITQVTLPASLSNIDGTAFNGVTTLATYYVSDEGESEKYYAESGILYDKTTTAMGVIPPAIQGAIEIPDFVESIPKECFKGIKITSIDLPDSVKSIGANAFENCTALTSITLPKNGNITKIENKTFNGCSSLTSIDIPNGVTSIGSNAFASCTVLSSVTIPNSVETIGATAFNTCKALTSITIPSSVTNIANMAFNTCSGLETVTIDGATADSEKTTTITTKVFNSCNSLESVTFGSGITSITNDNAFPDGARLRTAAGGSGTEAYTPNQGTYLHNIEGKSWSKEEAN